MQIQNTKATKFKCDSEKGKQNINLKEEEALV